MNINDLNNDASFIIFSFLDPKTLYNSASVCQKWKVISDDNKLWMNVANRLGLGAEIDVNSPKFIKHQVFQIKKEEQGHIIVRNKAQLVNELIKIYKKANREKITSIHYFSAKNKDTHIYISLGKNIYRPSLWDTNERVLSRAKDQFSRADCQFSIMAKAEADLQGDHFDDGMCCGDHPELCVDAVFCHVSEYFSHSASSQNLWERKWLNPSHIFSNLINPHSELYLSSSGEL